MSFIDRLSNGWKIAMNSFKVLKDKKELIVFPLLSGLSLLLIIGSYIFIEYSGHGLAWTSGNVHQPDTVTKYLFYFAFYLVNYFIVVFFNMGLIHCTRLYFRGEEVSVRKGLQYSLSHIGAIFSWALFAATVGTILKAIQENSGLLGKILSGVLGVVWGIATFFVVPVIAYENANPLKAFKRSSELMKQKWGESLAATFSFGLIQFLGILIIAGPLFFIGNLFDPFLGIALAVLGGFCVMAIISATQTIFVSAVYHNINDEPVKHFGDMMVNDLFTTRKKGL